MSAQKTSITSINYNNKKCSYSLIIHSPVIICVFGPLTPIFSLGLYFTHHSYTTHRIFQKCKPMNSKHFLHTSMLINIGTESYLPYKDPIHLNSDACVRENLCDRWRFLSRSSLRCNLLSAPIFVLYWFT